MNARRLKSKLLQRKVTLGSWLQIGNPIVTEIFAHAGFEWMVVDLEHSAIELPEMLVVFQILQNSNVVPFVRVSSLDSVQIKRVLDSGASGIIIPNIDSPEDAQLAVRYAYYPPLGKRGTGIFRAQGYGSKFKEYLVRARQETIIIVQIEHKDAVERIDEIVSVKGIDGFMIGPYDISASYGLAGEFDHPTVVKAIERIKRAVLCSNKSLGFHVVHPSEKEVARRIKQGFNFVACSIDTIMLQHFSTQFLGNIQRELKRKRVL